MATQLDPNVKDDLKTQFVTREGTYRLLTLSEYSRPNRVGYTNSQSSPQVRVSIVTLPNVTANPTTGGTGPNTPLSAAAAVNGNNPTTTSTGTPPSNGAGDGSAATSPTSTTAVSTLNGHGQPATATAASYGVPSGMDARLGAGISMHSMMNGSSGGGIEPGGLYNPVYGGDRICFNFGRELYVYAFRGVKKGTEMSKPIDKKFYKGTNPSCHDFNAAAATPTGAPLLVGFTTGQIQLISPQPGPRELRKLFNEERLIDRTKVTCLKWLPNSTTLFLAAHASGHLYLYNEELPCSPPTPTYQPFKMGDGYTILTCKSKSTRNPLYKWVFSTENCCINEFSFSPCGANLAIVSQDGFLRVFHYDTMELLGIARSYFGGFLCVCWSPDGKYIVVGGEDDLVTVWSLHERRVVARGQGHRSWVSVVAFDPYTTSYSTWDSGEFSDDENQLPEYMGTRESRFSGDSAAHGFDLNAPGPGEKSSTPNHGGGSRQQRPHSASFRSEASSSAALPPDKLAISYRLGSVSQDTQLCLWDITEDVLRHPLALRQRVNSAQLNDSSYMNGGVDADGVKVLRPVAIGSTSGSFPPPQHSSSPIREGPAPAAATEHSSSNSNSSSSKFSTANCTISSSHSSTANTPPEEPAANGAGTKSTPAAPSSSTLKFPNCIGGSAGGNHHGKAAAPAANSTFYTSGYTSKSSNSSNKSSDSGLSTFNSLTQRLTNFSFLGSGSGDKKEAANLTIASSQPGPHRNHRKTLSLLKSYNNHTGGGQSSTIEFHGSANSHSFGSLKLGRSSHGQAASAAAPSVATSYDPMKLIGTPACPRFDECPLLEPLVCKKIAHERLSALIFREDCFLTACQDGFIYTWARPGYATNVPQHMSPTQAAPPGGTVI